MSLFRSKDRPVAYTTEPAAAFLFRHSAKYREVTTATKPRCVLYVAPPEGLLRATKNERLGGFLPGLNPIQADVRNAIFEVIGVSGVESVLEAQSRADAPDRVQARRALDQVRMGLDGARIRLLNPQNRRNQLCLTEFTLVCPKERPITVRGNYSAVYASDLTGGADIETDHARIRILNVGPVVKARVREGIIDYSGSEGAVRLFAGWEVSLNFTSPEFKGEVEASAEGPVRVLIPEGFATAFEASVAKDSSFVCRAGIGPQITERKKGGRLIYTFGSGPAVIRLTSERGPIVMDTAPESV